MNNLCLRLHKYKLVRQFSLNRPLCGNQKQNHYDCLEITPKATQNDVKSAYYKLSKEYHPDLNKDNAAAAEKFRAITTAYEILGNVKNRKLYDRRLTVGSHDEMFTSDEDVDLNIKHASFHKQRNKPTRSKTTAKSEHYDIDEWTRAHYSSTFMNSYNFKQQANANVKENIDAEMQFQNHWQLLLLVLVIVFGACVCMEGTKSSYDKPTSSANKNDKDPN